MTVPTPTHSPDPALAAVLIFDPAARISGRVQAVLRENHYRAEVALSLGEVDVLLSRSHYDLLAVSLDTPGRDGLAVCADLIERDAAPVLAIGDPATRGAHLVALELGAQDCLASASDERELLARVRASLRRCRPALRDSALAADAIDGWTLDRRAHLLTAPSGREAVLTRNEAAVLGLLVDARGGPVGRADLLAALRTTSMEPQVVDRMVARLRVKLRRDLGADPIATVRGLGYLFAGD